MRWRNNNRERSRSVARERARRIRREGLEAYGGPNPVCACCGEAEEHFLVLDHINGGGNKDRKERGVSAGSTFYMHLRREGWPPGFRILCQNCNSARGLYGSCPHERNPVALRLVS